MQSSQRKQASVIGREQLLYPRSIKATKKCLACALLSRNKKQLSIFYQSLKQIIAALYRIKINNVSLLLGTYSQITRHRFCGSDASAMC